LLARVRGQAGRGPYQFARAFRVFPGGLSYGIFHKPRFYPFLWEVYEALRNLPQSGSVVVMKCAQTGWTETALNLALWFMAFRREGVLYMLPTESQLSDFSQARITPIIALSPVFRDAFSSADNVGLKLAFGFPIYLRGARSTDKLREIPVGLVIRDEYDVMDKGGAAQALSRLGASQNKWVYDISNPTFPTETGIFGRYMAGTQEEFVIKCPRCDLIAAPTWPDSYNEKMPYSIVCPDCKTLLNLEERWAKKAAYWQANNPTARYRSFHMNQLISPTVQPWEIMQQWEEAQGEIGKMQTFYNMTLGLPYAPAGSRITADIIRQLPRGESMLPGSPGPCCMGVDVGGKLHAVVRRMDGGIVWVGACTWEIMARLMHSYNVTHCGIDIAPETRKAKEFATFFPGRVTLIRYKPSSTATGQDEAEEEGLRKINISRTEALDKGMSRFLALEETVPTNLPEEFWRHIMALTRVIIEDGDKVYAAWEKDGPDHYAHAFAYSEIVRKSGGIYATSQIFPPGASRRKENVGEQPGDISRNKEGVLMESLDFGQERIDQLGGPRRPGRFQG